MMTSAAVMNKCSWTGFKYLASIWLNIGTLLFLGLVACAHPEHFLSASTFFWRKWEKVLGAAGVCEDCKSAFLEDKSTSNAGILWGELFFNILKDAKNPTGNFLIQFVYNFLVRARRSRQVMNRCNETSRVLSVSLSPKHYHGGSGNW